MRSLLIIAVCLFPSISYSQEWDMFQLKERVSTNESEIKVLKNRIAELEAKLEEQEAEEQIEYVEADNTQYRSVSRYSGPSWTWPGNLRSHLESTHGIDTDGLSHSELQDIHDNLHNVGSSGISGSSRTVEYEPTKAYSSGSYYRSSYQPVQYYYSSGYSSCPSGNCPSY